MFKNFKNATFGKQIGFISFLFTEIIIGMVIILSILATKDVAVDYTKIAEYQVWVLFICWGSKAASNFSNKIKKSLSGVQDEEH